MSGAFSGSVDELPSKFTARGALPSVIEAESIAVGAWFATAWPVIIIGVDVVFVAP